MGGEVSSLRPVRADARHRPLPRAGRSTPWRRAPRPGRRARSPPRTTPPTLAAFCWVTLSISATARLTCSMPAACSFAPRRRSRRRCPVTLRDPARDLGELLGHLPGGDLALARLLHRLADELLGLGGGLLGAQRERAHLLGHHREAAAGLAGPRSLDRGVEREEVGLEGDVVDVPDDLGGALGRGPDPRHGPCICSTAAVPSSGRAARRPWRVRSPAGRSSADCWVIARDRLDGGGGLLERARLLGGAGGDRLGGGGDLGGGRGHLLDGLDTWASASWSASRGGVDGLLDAGVVALELPVTRRGRSRWASFSRTAVASLTGAMTASSVWFTPSTTLRNSPWWREGRPGVEVALDGRLDECRWCPRRAASPPRSSC